MSIEAQHLTKGQIFPEVYPDAPGNPAEQIEQSHQAIAKHNQSPHLLEAFDANLAALKETAIGHNISHSLVVNDAGPESDAASNNRFEMTLSGGELPESTLVLLGSAYAMTGARIIGDNFNNGGSGLTEVIREGQFNTADQSHKLYFREMLSKTDSGETIFSVDVLSEKPVDGSIEYDRPERSGSEPEDDRLPGEDVDIDEEWALEMAKMTETANMAKKERGLQAARREQAAAYKKDMSPKLTKKLGRLASRFAEMLGEGGGHSNHAQ